MKTAVHFSRAIAAGALLALILHAAPASAVDPAEIPTICVSSVDANNLVVAAHIRAGFTSVVLETRAEAGTGPWSSYVSGAVDGREGMVVFTAPSPGLNAFYRVRVGYETTPPAATYSGSTHFTVVYGLSSCLFSEDERIGHVLNRLAYGPSDYDLQRIASIGLEAWMNEQLNPNLIDESANTELNSRTAPLFYSFQPANASTLVSPGEIFSYHKGTNEPPANWATIGFDDSNWETGQTGIGYGDNDDATVLDDMRYNYSTVYARKVFNVADPAAFDHLVLQMDYDDAFVAYLNGTEVVRANFTGTPAFDSLADGNHEAGSPEQFDISAFKNLLVPGNNVLAFVSINVTLDSSDSSLIPELLGKTDIPGIPLQTRIKGLNELQQLVHIRGAYAHRQLQSVLAEFWQNHFTTDYNKVRDYFDGLNNSDATDAMIYSEAEKEAAEAKYREYEFFHDNALGYFGDLLLYSATSPAQLIYLDNVLNVKGAPNENYAREIMELFAFGVDNRYTQTDIEQLARCFTGWTVRKVWPQDAPTYPDSARNPPTDESVQFQDTTLLDLGSGWKYLKGTAEPTPVNGEPTTAWAENSYNDSAWSDGATPLGYGEEGYGVDNWYGTQLPDMRQTANQTGYPSVYLRRKFTVNNPATLQNLVLSLKCDDGVIVYVNGTEVARTRTMEGTGTPPPFDKLANGNAVEPLVDQNFSLKPYLNLLLPAPQENVIAIELHNVSLTSSDAAIAPKIILRDPLPGSIENGDPNGLWTFRFNPDEHDTNSKTLFAGTAYQIDIPGGRTGISGLLDATDVIDAMESHPSTEEFICLKLINKFVSDEINLDSYHNRTASPELLDLMDNAIAAWNTPVNGRKGHIGTVLNAIIQPVARLDVFWGEAGYKTKIKTPVEYINSTIRALNSAVDAPGLPNWNERMGMHLFDRLEPNGWSEIGDKWMDSGTLLQRIEFCRLIAGNSNSAYQWDVAGWVAANNITSAADIVDYFNHKLFQGTLMPEHISILVDYGNTAANGTPSTLDPTNTAHAARVRELVGLILSLPQWQYQ
ncbi:DUF1800 family protein [bacterium]|nr:DUF1800 family protein [bacterium]